MAATIVGAPNIAAIPIATPIIKPQETLPVKKPIPTEIIAKAAKALPPLPVTTLSALHIVPTRTFELTSETAVPAKASDDKTGTIAGATAKKTKDKRAAFAKKEESFFIVFNFV